MTDRLVGALILTGVPPDQARRMPVDLASRVVRAARTDRPSVDAFLTEALGPDEAPLDANLRLGDFMRRLRHGEDGL